MKRFLCILACILLLCGCGVPEEDMTSTEATEAPPPKEVTVFLSDAFCDKVTWRKITDAFTATTGILITNVKDPALADVVHLPQDEAIAFLSECPAAKIPGLPQVTLPGEQMTVANVALPGLMDSYAAAPEGAVQFLPVFCSGYGLGYNASLFEDKGWKVPTTWEELWALAETAKAEGIYLLTYSDASQLKELMYAVLYSVGGVDFFRRASQYEEGIWSGEDGRACAAVMTKLASYTHPMTPSHITSQQGEKNLHLWLHNEVLFFPAGQHTAAQIRSEEKAENFQLGIAPVMAADKGRYVYLDTQQIWVSSSCENPVSAIRFLAFLYSEVACNLFGESDEILPVITHTDAPPEDCRVATGSFRSYHTAVEAGSLQNIFLTPFGQLVNGTVTMDEWIRNTENAMTAIRGSLKDK